MVEVTITRRISAVHDELRSQLTLSRMGKQRLSGPLAEIIRKASHAGVSQQRFPFQTRVAIGEEDDV